MRYGFALLVVAIIWGCSETPRFTEVSQAAGVKSVNTLRPDDSLNIITYLYYYNGGGVAATDISGDGLPDLYFTNNQEENRYFINEGNWTFRDATREAGVAGSGDWSTGVSIVDVNQDGLLDIYVCNVAGYRGLTGGNELFIQQKDGSFREAAAEYGLDFVGFSTQAYWFDYDLDGDLDCYLLCHSIHNDATYGKASFRQRPDEAAGDRLYECVRRGKQVFYRRLPGVGEPGHADWRSSKLPVTARPSGIYTSKIGYGLSASIADFDGNGRPDIYVCNDFSENDYLYLNRSERAEGPLFEESIRERMGHSSNFSMGSATLDLDADGWPDLFTLDMRPADPTTLLHTANADSYNVDRIKRRLGYHHQYPRNNLQWNRGRGHFSEVGQLAGVAASDWSWSALAADFDLDGQTDIFVANGIPRRPNDLDYLKFISGAAARSVGDQEMAARMPPGAVANVMYRGTGTLSFVEVGEDWGLGGAGCSNGAAYADFDQDGDLDLVVNNLNAPAALYRNNTDSEKNHTEEDVTPQWVAHPQQGMMSQSEGSLFGGTVGIAVEGERSTRRSKSDPNKEFATSLVRKIRTLTVPRSGTDVFDAEPLLPYELELPGQAVAVGRVNGNEVIYVGGGSGVRPRLHTDAPDLPLPDATTAGDLLADSVFQDAGAVFFDADGDGSDELLVTSGGYTSRPADRYRDRMYKFLDGSWRRCADCLPPSLRDMSGVAVAGDFDADGDEDLFIGSRGLPGLYGAAGNSRVLLNDGAGKFTEDSAWREPKLGMVTAADWEATTRELIVAGEWMEIGRWQRDGEAWQYEAIGPSGLWRSLARRGDTVWAGNWGLNSDLGQPSVDEPLRLYAGDLDQNGKSDPIVTRYRAGREVALASKDELGGQLPALRRNNLSFRDYAERDFRENFAAFGLSRPQRVNTLAHLRLERKSGEWTVPESLDRRTQISCVNTILVTDAGLLLGGNMGNVTPVIGRQDAADLQLLFDGIVRYPERRGRAGRTTSMLLSSGEGHILEVHIQDN